MNKNEKNPSRLLAAFLLGGVVIYSGCESKGPAESAGEKIDKGVQSAKDAIDPPGALEKAGRGVDEAIKP